MFEDFYRGRAARRTKPGDGSPLKPFRWWQMLSRSVFSLTIPREDGAETVYTVSVKHGGDSETGVVTAQLYRDGILTAVSKLPAFFAVPGGTIEVATSTFGLKRCHYVTDDGREQQLEPDPRSAEGRRAAFDRAHPAASRVVGGVAVLVLIVGVVVAVPQLIEAFSAIPPLAERFGTFDSPIQLPVVANVVVGIATGAASIERALRLRYNWLLDAVAN